ncbi:mitochondrial carrier domain-containing protein [Cantharellus anzutake]|uniref:mitochondrial carrier domain-containing protein n=1 Tax=Cantharellus anzutake TaxID=1750568 RepID=UPI0019075B33|nr:mitochondrial carrier domain-containing protein [Cantharellus anzutake]KAF8339584.1 mitochondrial carrier domain-containing protein [Cantharellus anzutake]
MVAASKPVTELTPFGYALAGALGGVFSNAVVYPLDTVKTRIQASSSSEGKAKPTILTLLVSILKNEGIGGYYKGFGASMLNTFSMQYAYFFFYSIVRGAYIRRQSAGSPQGKKAPSPSTAAELILGAFAGALAQIFTIPVAVIATRQQVSTVKPLTAEEKALGIKRKGNGFFEVAQDIVREDGVGGLWLGIKPGLILTVNPAITYGLFERVKSVVLFSEPAGAKMFPWQSFVVGALSKSLATVVTYPYIMAKVRVQARGSTEAEEDDAAEKGEAPAKKTPRYTGSLDVLKRVLKEDGFIGWYRGMNAQITKAVLSQALLFMSKDQFERYALAIMIVWSKLSAK